MITYEECETQGWIPPKQHHQVPQVRPIVPASSLLRTANATERHLPSPLRFSLPSHDIGSFIQKIQERKLASEQV